MNRVRLTSRGEWAVALAVIALIFLAMWSAAALGEWIAPTPAHTTGVTP